MKNLITLFLGIAIATFASAQTASFTVTTTPCHDDGVLTATFTGLTPPLTVTWTTFGIAGTVTTHTGVSGLSDALSSYSGGTVNLSATDGTSYAYGYFAGLPPFTYTVTTTAGICPAPGSAMATVTGGTMPYTYQWFDVTTMSTVSTTNPATLPDGSYGVTITDAAGCTFGSLAMSDSAYIYSVAPFSVAVSNTTASCTNGTATVGPLTGGTAPYSYLWSNAATTSSIAGLVMGDYSVTVTDASGCSAIGYTYVRQAITIGASVTPTPATCTASDGAAIVFGSGGLPPYTYAWSNGATTQAQTGLASGYYGITVTDANGCIGTGGTYVSVSTPITVTYSATSSSCTSATGSATVAATGGTLPYTVNWLTTPPQTGLTATALPPGTYDFNVTDAAGCIRSGSVPVPPVDVITASFSSTSAHCTTSTGAISVAPTGGVTPYSYSWNTGATTAGLTGVPGGGYSVTITDANGCRVTKYGTVYTNSPVGIGLVSSPASCIFATDGIISATAFGGTSPYSYSWSNGGTTSSITSLPYGPYWLGVTDATGCVANGYTYLSYNPGGTSCYCTISGTVYYDINGNCTQDPGEPGIPHIQIYCSGIGYTYTDGSGHYSFIVPSGSYTITETILAYYPLATCQLNNIAVTTVAGTGCVHTVDFANSINPIHDMHISTWDYTFAIPGHTYTQATVISNEGTVSEASILSAYKPDGQLFAPTFIPSGIFAGSPYYYNTSAGFPTLSPGSTEHFFMNYSVPTSIPLGTNVLFKDSVAYSAPMSNWLTDYSPWNNVNYFSTTTIASYDPNFKEVSPKGTGPTGIISYSDSVLEYMVHFQNTGSAPAENVTVVDTLDNNLDWTSLHPIYLAAQGKVTLTQSGPYKIATFTFYDINLPPSASEPMLSNSFFTYTIKTRMGLPLGSQFKNRAAIYFDYNAPVMTNTTINTLGSTTAVNPIPSLESNSFTIYPNPTNKTFNTIINSSDANDGSIKVCDVTGKQLINKAITLQKGQQTISTDVSYLTPGIYFVSLVANGKTQTQKLIIMK